MGDRPDKRLKVSDISPQDVLALLEGSPNASNPDGYTEHDLDANACKSALQLLVSTWTSKSDGRPMATIAADRFGLLDLFEQDSLVPHGSSGLKKAMDRKQLCLIRLRYHFVRLNIMDLEDTTDDPGGSSFRGMFIRVHECTQRLYDCLMTSLLTYKCLDPQWATDCPTHLDPYYVVPFDLSKLSGAQSFIIFVADQLQKMNLRRYRGCCYQEVESPPFMVKGKLRTFKTHAWKRYMDISEFVEKCAPKETHFTMWQNMITGDTKSKTKHHLEFGYEIQFPDLKPDRHWHAFPNGLYCTNVKQFYPWGHAAITSNITACKYHEAEFDESIMDIERWQDIETPFFQTILDTQLKHIVHIETDASGGPKKWTAEEAMEENAERLDTGWPSVEAGQPMLVPEGHKVIEWAYIMLGRVLFEVNEKDSWQVIPFFIGRAGTGKSLILSIASSFFEDADVEFVSNDNQKGFGLETVHDKKIWMVKEVKHDFAIDQAQFQSMITGEEMSIMRKNKTALQVIWRVPGLLAGNEMANWSDNSGSISRRLILFYFNKRVSNSDPNMAERLKQELPKLMHKCCRAYAQAVLFYGKSDLWAKNPRLLKKLAEDPDFVYRGSRTILPSYFHFNKAGVKKQTHQMENFLANRDEVAVPGAESGLGMPYELDDDGRPSFKTKANAFFKKQDSKASFPWSKEDRYRCTFEDYGLEIRRLALKDIEKGHNRYCGHDYPVDTNWIFGVVPRSEADVDLS
jgi:hypothetical protein